MGSTDTKIVVRGYEYVDPCRCLECAGDCTFKVPKRWFQCNPCSKGFHLAPCERFVPGFPAHLVLECEDCGYWEVDH